MAKGKWRSEVPAAHKLAERVKRLRREAGLSQDALAAAARRLGLPWDRDTVVNLEDPNRRRLSWEELLIVRPLLAELLGRPVGWEDLFPDENVVLVLTDRVSLPPAGVRALLSGEDLRIRPAVTIASGKDAVAVLDDARLVRRILRGHDVPPEVLADLPADAQGLAEKGAAANTKIAVSPEAVVAAAYVLWGRSLTAERDRRVAEKTGADAKPRSIQAVRGHVTRELLDELALTIRRAKGGNR